MAVNQKNGKEAITNFKVLKLFKGYSLVKPILIQDVPESGRFTYINHPIVGDIIYGNRKDDEKYEELFPACQEVRFYSS